MYVRFKKYVYLSISHHVIMQSRSIEPDILRQKVTPILAQAKEKDGEIWRKTQLPEQYMLFTGRNSYNGKKEGF